MGFSLRDLYKRCADKQCNKQFVPSYESVYMQVTLGDAIQSHIYCSNKCFESTLSKVNKGAGEFEKIKLIFKERISSKPDKWLLAYEHDMPEIRILQ